MTLPFLWQPFCFCTYPMLWTLCQKNYESTLHFLTHPCPIISSSSSSSRVLLLIAFDAKWWNKKGWQDSSRFRPQLGRSIQIATSPLLMHTDLICLLTWQYSYALLNKQSLITDALSVIPLINHCLKTMPHLATRIPRSLWITSSTNRKSHRVH